MIQKININDDDKLIVSNNNKAIAHCVAVVFCISRSENRVLVNTKEDTSSPPLPDRTSFGYCNYACYPVMVL